MITLHGSGFGDGATVTFDGLPATAVVVHDQTRITCEPPDHADGFVTVVVTNPDGTTGELADAFVYTTLTVSPNEGSIGGGETVTLTISDGGAGIAWFPAGHDFLVFIDNSFAALGIDLADPDLSLNPAHGGQLPFTWVSNNQLACVTNEYTCGTADVVVFDMDLYAAHQPNVVFYAAAATFPAGGYNYILPPPVLADLAPIVPTSGPSRGGTHVVISGSFACTPCHGHDAVTAEFDGVPLTSLGCAPTTITGITGAHTAGVVDVVVTGPDGQATLLPAAFTYLDPPTVSAIVPDHGPDLGGTAITITGADFLDGATVAMHGVVMDGGFAEATLADCFDVVVLDATTITAMTGGHPAAVVDVVVTNPDGQRGTLEHGYEYDGWWFDDDVGDWWYGADPPDDRDRWTWMGEPPLTPSPHGWWMSTAAYGGDVFVYADTRPKNPRTWAQIAAFATGPAAMLGGSPGIAVVFHNRMVYAASDYTVGTTAPPLRIFDGSFDRELCRLPPTPTNTVPIAVLSMLVANGTIYLSSFDSGSTSADWIGRVFSLDLNTATLTPIGAAFPAGHLPYALAWHNGMLWVGTHRQTTDVAGKVFRIRPDLADAAWTEDHTWDTGYNTAALCSWQGTLYAGLTAAAGTFGQVVKRGSDNAWTTADTGSGGTATANNGFLAFRAFGEALYASYWNHDTPAVARIRKTTDGTTWTTVYTGAAGTIRPFIVLAVDDHELFAIGGGAHLTAAILRSGDGTTWTDLTNELPEADKTALPAVATVVF